LTVSENPSLPGFDVERFQRLALERRLGFGSPIGVRTVTESTNDDARTGARAGAPHGSIFVADEQTQGRGRRGNRWLSQPRRDLLVSILLRPAWTAARCQGVSLAVGLAVRDTVARWSPARAMLKWPNDVLADGRKVAGILIETELDGRKLRALVLGIGLNVHGRELPQELSTSATSLALVGGLRLEREAILADLLAALEQRLAAFEASGVPGLVTELAAYDALAGKRVTVEAVTGIGSGFDEQGALLVTDDAGHVHAIHTGHVELYPPSTASRH
jgi:BirA family biotin operon repressor/biotin-[acetyl-CoA-carboxylase] ligase